MAIFSNKLSSLPDLIVPLKGSVEALVPGATSADTLIGNVVNPSGVSDDIIGGVGAGSASGLISNVYADGIGTGAAVQDLFDGSGLGVEPLLAEKLPPIDDLPGVSQVVTALDPVTTVVADVNAAILDFTEDLSPGTSSAYVLTGNIIGPQGIVDDVVTNFHEGSPSGAILDVYKDILGPGGIINNLGDGLGTGLEPFVHDLDGVEGQLPVVEQVPELLGTVPGSVVDTLEDLSPGASAPETLTGNIVGSQGIVDDVLVNFSEGSVTGGVVAAYDDTFAPGGIFNNLGDGHGLGVETLVDEGPKILDDLPLVGQAGDVALPTGALDLVAALVGGGDSVSDATTEPLGALTGLLGGSDLLSAVHGLDLLGGDHSL